MTLLKPVEIAERTRAAVEPLRDLGLSISIPSRGPIATQVMSFGLQPSNQVFTFWLGNADFQIVDTQRKPKRQAVIRIAEKDHSLTQTVVLRNERSKERTRTDSYTQAELRNLFPTNLPEGTTFKVAKDGFKLKTKERPRYTFNPRTRKDEKSGVTFEYQWSVEITAKVPDFDNTFLIGFDEQRCFISQLPKPVETVEEAYKVLRPAGAIEGSLRQGEWFFVPLSKAETVIVEDLAWRLGQEQNLHVWPYSSWQARDGGSGWSTTMAPGHRQYVHGKPILETPRPLESGSTHTCIWIADGDTKYAWGTVFDTRKGRHEPLELETWHRVLRNNEVNPPPVRVAERDTMGNVFYTERQNRNWD